MDDDVVNGHILAEKALKYLVAGGHVLMDTTDPRWVFTYRLFDERGNEIAYLLPDEMRVLTDRFGLKPDDMSFPAKWTLTRK